MTLKTASLLLATLLPLLPGSASAQGSPLLRVTGSAGMWTSDTYDNLTVGRDLGVDLLFGRDLRFGVGARLAEYPYDGEAETLVTGGVDLVLASVRPSGFYVEGRGGYQAQGFDVSSTRYAYQGFNVGGGIGFLQPFGPAFFDIGLEAAYFSSFAAWANDNELDDTLSGTRVGLRLGLALGGGTN